MNPKMLAKQFDADPGSAYLEVIRSADQAVNKKTIIETLAAAGVRPKDADARWPKFSEFAKKHPNIRSKKGSALYAWSSEPVPSAEALATLESRILKSTPGWLTDALLAVVRDSLAHNETQGTHSQTSWSERQAIQQARLVGEFAAASADGELAADPDLLRKWIEARVEEAHVEPFGDVGQVVNFDSDLHTSTAGAPTQGTQVVVMRQGYRWFGLDEPLVVVRARVR